MFSDYYLNILIITQFMILLDLKQLYITYYGTILMDSFIII